MTIMWETDRPTTSVVNYGRANPPTKRAQSEGVCRIHEVKLTGLEPQTQYFYSVQSTDTSGETVTSDVFTFQTAVRPGFPYVFAVIGDSRSFPKVYKQITQLVWERRPNFVIHLGDIVTAGKKKHEWIVQCFQPSEELLARVPMLPTLGNHEQDAHWYYDYFSLPQPEYYYDYVYGNAHFFVVDTDHSLEPDTEQTKWLDRRLGESTATWKFVYHHHPAYSSDEDDYGDTRKGGSTFGDERVQKNLVPLYEKHGVDIVFAGHIHVYERSWPIRAGKVDLHNGVHYVICGGGAAELETFAPVRTWFANRLMRGYHYVCVRIHETTLEYQAYDIEGRVFDSFEIRK